MLRHQLDGIKTMLKEDIHSFVQVCEEDDAEVAELLYLLSPDEAEEFLQ